MESRNVVRRVTIRSAPRETADILREAILSHSSERGEWLLGSEDEMIGMLGVSRPTLRQAARMLEQEQLLVVRRGIGGGLFGRRPAADAVSHTASVYLRSQGTTYTDLIRTQRVLGEECARLAATNPDRAAREQLRDFCDGRADNPGPLSAGDFIAHSVDFQSRVAALAESPSLRLFLDVLVDLLRRSEAIRGVYADRELQIQTLRRHRAIADSIAEGDPEQASGRMREHLEIVHDQIGEATRLERLSPHPPG